MRKSLFLIIALFGIFMAHGQEPGLKFTRKALDVGVYDYDKAVKNSYKIYYEEEADEKFNELLINSDRLLNSGIFGQYMEQEDGSVVFFMEEEAYEYCPELNYVMKTGGHGYVSAYDLSTLEEIYVNPSTHTYSPSGKYRFGTFDYEGRTYYIEVREGETYIPHQIAHGTEGDMTGVYWADDETLYFLSEKKRADGITNYHIGYSLTILN